MNQQLTTDVTVGGIQVTPFASMAQAVNAVIAPAGDVHYGFGIAINPEKVVLAQQDETVRATLQSATLRFADGTGVVRTLRKKGVANTRIPGCEFWEALMLRAAELQVPVMLIEEYPNSVIT